MALLLIQQTLQFIPIYLEWIKINGGRTIAWGKHFQNDIDYKLDRQSLEYLSMTTEIISSRCPQIYNQQQTKPSTWHDTLPLTSSGLGAVQTRPIHKPGQYNLRFELLLKTLHRPFRSETFKIPRHPRLQFEGPTTRISSTMFRTKYLVSKHTLVIVDAEVLGIEIYTSHQRFP